MSVSDEAVEAAARAIARYETGTQSPIPNDTDIAHARTALEAAAPFIAAQAWDEGWDAMADFDHRQAGQYPSNPYRSGK